MLIFIIILSLIIFIYSITLLSKTLFSLSKNKFLYFLNKHSNNNLLLFIIGIIITALIQSSSLTNIIIMSFVNSKIIKLENSLYFILGSNIGTCVTNQLLAVNPTILGPLLIIIGIILLIYKKPLNGVFLGLGFLMTSMHIITISLNHLQNNFILINLLNKYPNKYITILIGILFTSIIQSSAASIGIYQSLAQNNLITINNAIYLLLGSNIGTCFTSLIASLKLNRDAKIIAILNIIINTIGVIIFTIIYNYINLQPTYNKSLYIANIHLYFNILSSIIIYPFIKPILNLTKKIIKKSLSL